MVRVIYWWYIEKSFEKIFLKWIISIIYGYDYMKFVNFKDFNGCVIGI